MDFGYLLAGGMRQAGGAYAKNQADQRQFNLEQKSADADMLRKENYARFKVDIEGQAYQDKKGVDFEAHKQAATFDKGMDGSGYWENDRELTNEELKKRPNGTQGLTSGDDRKTQKEIDRRKKIKDSDISEQDRRAKEAGASPEEMKNIKRRQAGLVTLQEAGEDPKVAKKATEKISYNLGKVSKEVKKELGVSDRVADLIAYDNFLSTSDQGSEELIKGHKRQVAHTAVNSIMSQFPEGANEYDLKRMFKEGKFSAGKKRSTGETVPLSQADFDLVMEYYSAKGELPEVGGLESIFRKIIPDGFLN